MRTMFKVWIVAVIGCLIGAVLQNFEVIQAPAHWALYGAIWGAIALAAQVEQFREAVSTARPTQNLAEIKAQAIESVLDNCQAWSMMNTYAITVEDIAEYANTIRSEAAK